MEVNKISSEYILNNIAHKLVLVAGTTDAGNLDDDGTRAKSYESVKCYWDKQFRKDIKALESSILNLNVLDVHGWTGDNRVKNREIAGAYLINRLCGAEGQKPYYGETHQNRAMYFHLLGHSHGGNVINEMTKQIEKLGDKWPKKWKIKSITYLSTPFFDDIHQVNEKGFHKDIEILNVYNKYDLTQRLLADFSLEPLAGAMKLIDTKELEEKIEKLKDFDYEKILEHLNNWEFNDRDDSFWGTDLSFEIPHEYGLAVCNQIIELCEDAKGLFTEVLKIVDALGKPIEFKVGKQIVNDLGKDVLSYKRVIIPEEIVDRFDTVIKTINDGFQITIERLKTRNETNARNNSKYLISGIFADIEINKIVDNLFIFFNIDSSSLKSEYKNGLFNLLYEILDHNIEKFDDTYHNPSKQFESNIKIKQFEVTQYDAYDGKIGSENFDEFIDYIEKAEVNYKDSANQYNLLDIVFTLVQGSGLVVREYGGYGIAKTIQNFYSKIEGKKYINKNFRDRIKQLSDMTKNYDKIFKKRDFGNLIDTTHKPKDLIPDINDACSDKEVIEKKNKEIVIIKKEIESHKKEIENLKKENTKGAVEKIKVASQNVEIIEEKIKKAEEEIKPDKELQRGSTMYLLTESHSTSRRYLHKEVKEFIKRLAK